MHIRQLENELWAATDQLRANSKLTAAECGLILLRQKLMSDHLDVSDITLLGEIAT